MSVYVWWVLECSYGRYSNECKSVHMVDVVIVWIRHCMVDVRVLQCSYGGYSTFCILYGCSYGGYDTFMAITPIWCKYHLCNYHMV